MNLRCLRPLIAAALACIAGSAAALSASGVVISQVYGGGGNAGATYYTDFVELHNNGPVAVTMTGWSIQYASATGVVSGTTALSGTIQPGQYFLVQEATPTAVGLPLPTPDVTGTIAMAAGAGKVILANTTVAVTSVTGSTVQDYVGYGTTANLYEGSGPAPAPSATLADVRATGGCTDTDDNAADFTAITPTPRNTTSTRQVCSGTTNAPIVATCPAFSVNTGTGGGSTFTATDADGIVNTYTSGALASGITVGPLVAASAVGGTASLPVTVASSVGVGTYTVALTFGNNQGQTTNCSAIITVNGAAVVTKIYTIQGSAATSPLVGQSVTTNGVVTKVMNAGFFLQDPIGDGNPLTSDGIYVFTSTVPTVTAGQLVQLTGTVAEFNVGASTNTDTLARPVTELTGISGVVVLGTGSVTPVTVTMPLANRDDMERYEGMVVMLTGPFTIGQNYFLGRYGQLSMSVLGRLEGPTNKVRPGQAALAMEADNLRRLIILDDGSTLQNVNPTPYLAADNTNRAGDTVETVLGVIDYGLTTAANTDAGNYKIQPINAPTITRTNPRTTAPDDVGGNIKIAAANVLNFFTTFQDGTTASGQTGQGCTLGGSTTSASNCRGANSLAEYIRQRDKIVEELAGINADAVGIMELQNNGEVAVQTLVNALNVRLGSQLYEVVPAPVQGTGTDAIRVGMIYKPSKLQRVGASVSNNDAINNRPPFAQTFAAATGEKFTFVVNHLKSKSSCPDSGADSDQGDLQGCWNATRVLQATALRNFVTTLQSSSGSNDVLMVGDFNSYAQEDPIAYLTGTAGYVDQIGRFNSFGYSYVFNSEAGRLDHAITTPTMSSKVTKATEWHVNADEPLIIDYNLEFKQPACPTCGPDYYTKSPYRASDHDPVVIGLQFGAASLTSKTSRTGR